MDLEPECQLKLADNLSPEEEQKVEKLSQHNLFNG
tara:strand:- start:260 stop:364 length:105 start_codon:yes stop_codon:yes gene_type:complete